MYEIHVNVSKIPYTYEWETVGKYHNYTVAWEECEKLRAAGHWAIVKDDFNIHKELSDDARIYTKRYTKTETVTNWRRESWGSAEAYTVSIERITEAYTEYSESKMYW